MPYSYVFEIVKVIPDSILAITAAYGVRSWKKQYIWKEKKSISNKIYSDLQLLKFNLKKLYENPTNGILNQDYNDQVDEAEEYYYSIHSKKIFFVDLLSKINENICSLEIDKIKFDKIINNFNQAVYFINQLLDASKTGLTTIEWGMLGSDDWANTGITPSMSEEVQKENSKTQFAFTEIHMKNIIDKCDNILELIK